jgi:uncharacterized membrane protein YbhN (UPF0104 family)
MFKNKGYYIKIMIVAVVLFFFVRYLYKNWSLVSQYQWKFQYELLAISLLLVIFNFIFLIEVWRKLLSALGYTLGFKKAFKIWFYSSMGKYIPGKLWSIMGMVYLCEKEGIPKGATLTSAILNQAFNMVGGLILVAILSGRKLFGHLPTTFYLVFGLILIISLYPSLMEKLLNFFLRIMKKEKLKIKLSFRQNLGLVSLYMIAWIVYGLAFSIFIKSLASYSFNLFPFITAIFAFSYIVGFLSVFVPGGIGVREGLMTLYLSGFFPPPVATLISLLSRLWLTAAEALGVLVSTRF